LIEIIDDFEAQPVRCLPDVHRFRASPVERYNRCTKEPRKIIMLEA
jgi:hypothetical protein